MNPKLTRRNFLRLSLAGAATLALPLNGCSFDFGGDGLVGKTVRSTATLPRPFGVPLPIPPRLEPIETSGEGDIYELTQREAQAEILPGLSTTIWGYNGIYPGPTIEVRRGRQITVRAHNKLPVPTVIHLHGGLTAPEHDGYPIDFILPDGWHGNAHSGHGGPEMPAGDVSHASRDYVYPLDQRAATLWYHDHRMDFTGPQVYKGLAGFLIVRDDEDDNLPLPKGDKDIPLMIADRSFGEDGAFLYPARDPSLLGEPGVERDFRDGVLGDTILVNGAPWPFHEVSATRHRFRVLNASNARRYELELDPPPPDGAAFIQVGSDGGLLAEPVNHDRLEISPAERYDIVIDFAQYPVGTRVTLKNRLGDGSTGRIMQFHITHSEPDDGQIPDQLSEIEPLDPDDAATTRSFRFHAGDVHGTRGWLVDDDPFHPDNIAASPRYGDTEIWELRGNTHHPIHLHLVHFQVLSRDGNRPSARDAGWKDTVNLNSGEQVRVIARFTGHRGKYVFHCHNLEHEDMAMMANFEVV